MLRFIATDKGFYEDGLVFLTDTRSVETEFIRILNWHKDAFRDVESLKLMKDIDSAKRQGDYGVVTPIGESCISCLSTGCKFGLLMLFFKKKQSVKLMVEISAAGINVWNWLANNICYEVYICREKLYYEILEIDNAEVVDAEDIYNKDDKGKYWEFISKCEDYPYQMTPELEKRAYEDYCRFRDEKVSCFPKEEIDIATFVKRFPKAEQYLNDEYDGIAFSNYKIINHCANISNDFSVYRRLPLYVCGKSENHVRYQKACSVKWPDFLEIMFFDVLDGDWWDWVDGRQTRNKYGELFTSWFVLVLNGSEQCKVEEYPREALLGIEVDTEKKVIIIYDREQAVERFHILYLQC